MEYYNDILCVEARELIQAGVLSENTYGNMTKRKQLHIVRRGCKNSPALIAVSSLPSRFYLEMVSKIGDPKKMAPRKTLEDFLVPDPAAMDFFTSYRTLAGKALPPERLREYCMNVSVLNALSEVVNSKRGARGVGGGTLKGLWQKIAETLSGMKARTGHSLPDNPARLRDKYREYMRNGYTSLISGKYGNNNSRKVTDLVERIVLSLYAMPNKPYASTTHELYLQFLSGILTVADVETGEIFSRDDFYDDKGTLIVVSESTVWNILNDPKNRAIVDKVRMGTLDYMAVHRPHHHRRSPDFSFSKISMDDRDLPRKMHDGTRVKAYYAYDVASGCVIGRSYSRKKTTALFVDCMRDMFRFINSYHIGMPMEVEVEHHIVNQFADDMMRAGILFPFVRWCNPGNSQEKRAEHFNREKKYGYEKRYQEGIGRFYARLEANRPRTEKIFDEDNNNYKEKTYPYEELVADDLDIIEKYNNGLHRNQKKYPGKTRLQVLLENQNPHMAEIDPVILTRYIGECTRSSIRHNMYIRVQYQNYSLSSPYVLENLQPNNYEVEAYYMPSDNIQKVYVFQNDVYIDTCQCIMAYNEATAEQTDADRESYTRQAKYVSQFDKMVKDGKKRLAKVAIIPNEQIIPEQAVSVSPVRDDQVPEDDFNPEDYLTSARRMAKNNL